MEKLVSYSFTVSKKTLSELKNKFAQEGYGMQEGFNLLVHSYIQGRFDNNGELHSNREID